MENISISGSSLEKSGGGGWDLGTFVLHQGGPEVRCAREGCGEGTLTATIKARQGIIKCCMESCFQVLGLVSSSPSSNCRTKAQDVLGDFPDLTAKSSRVVLVTLSQ